MSRNQRYDDILRQIARRRQADACTQPLVEALDAVNTTGYLEEVQSQRFKRILCYGPKTCRGEGWLGSLLWYRQRGYYGYKTLHLLGIWAITPPPYPLPIHGEGDKRGAAVQIVVGTRALAFAIPGYNPESYHKIIKTRFDIYYNDEGAPPDETGRLYSAIYDPTRRLDIRTAIQAALQQWAQAWR